ncbi:hypothetical protein ACWD3I_42100 [Streptomyces sp. NPDC002817]|uniref:hypothetical protein n=1 Tax=Streptomyces sp. NPDC088357 TaxID=3154655 RepID=UPI00344518D7
MSRRRVNDSSVTTVRALRSAVMLWPFRAALTLVIVVTGTALTGLGLHRIAGVATSTSVIVATTGGLVLLGLAAGAVTLAFRVIVFVAQSDKYGRESAAGRGVHAPGNIPIEDTGADGWPAPTTNTGDASEVWE